ncbi:zinc-dependent alcohol dehydrogenase family protein [Aliidongia dinghuensis]|nr:zinc-dependent alcohol dehydrogenase family protein [Aliidongia dinghuensis]
MSLPHSMRALVLETYGQPLVARTLPVPTPKAGEVLVRVAASGVNPLDLKIKAGQAAHAQMQPPAVLGIDLAGTVVVVGPGVDRFRPGDEVYGMTGGVGGLQGSLAEYAAVDADLLALKPANLTMREAAALPLIFITAWEGLVDRAAVRAGQKVLVQGGAGGVGHIAIQLAKAYGAEVFATDGAAKREIIERLGATAIDYKTTTVADYVTAHTDGAGFDIVYDTAGGASLDASFEAVRAYGGHVMSCLGWGTHALAPLSFKAATYSGVFTLMPMLTGKHRAHHGEIMAAATKLVEAGKLAPRLDPRRFTLEAVEDAHAALANRSAQGKIVVEVAA